MTKIKTTWKIQIYRNGLFACVYISLHLIIKSLINRHRKPRRDKIEYEDREFRDWRVCVCVCSILPVHH